jgi:hypothetical protein
VTSKVMQYYLSETVGHLAELTPWALKKRLTAAVYGPGAHSSRGGFSMLGAAACLLVAVLSFTLAVIIG